MLRVEVAAAPSAVALVLAADQPTKTSITSPRRLQGTAVFTTGASHVSWGVITDPRPAFLTCNRCRSSIRRSNLLVYDRTLTGLINFRSDQASNPNAIAAVLNFRSRATFASKLPFQGLSLLVRSLFLELRNTPCHHLRSDSAGLSYRRFVQSDPLRRSPQTHQAARPRRRYGYRLYISFELKSDSLLSPVTTITTSSGPVTVPRPGKVSRNSPTRKALRRE